MKYLLLISWLVSLSTTKPIVLSSVEDHYWRDFTGLIPSDAILGGCNAKGEKFYVGQTVIHRNEIWEYLPTRIFPNSKVVNVAYAGGVENVTDLARIKVMCSSNVQNYHWQKNNEPVPPRCRYVVAGRESDSPIYVGRETRDNDTVIGKYFADNRFLDLIAPHKGIEIFFRTYEALTYCE